MAAEPIVIFGAGDWVVSLVRTLVDEGDLAPVAFTVDREHLPVGDRGGLPVIPFDEVASVHPPERFRMIVALGWRRMMLSRRSRCEEATGLGYELVHWRSRHANIWPDLPRTPNTLVLPGATVLPYAELGPDVCVRSNVVVSHHVAVGAHTTLAHGVTIGGGAVISTRCWVGLGATLRDGVRLAEGTLVGAGAAVVADTEPDGVYVGVPARRLPGVSATARTA